MLLFHANRQSNLVDSWNDTNPNPSNLKSEGKANAGREALRTGKETRPGEADRLERGDRRSGEARGRGERREQSLIVLDVSSSSIPSPPPSFPSFYLLLHLNQSMHTHTPTRRRKGWRFWKSLFLFLFIFSKGISKRKNRRVLVVWSEFPSREPTPLLLMKPKCSLPPLLLSFPPTFSLFIYLYFLGLCRSNKIARAASHASSKVHWRLFFNIKIIKKLNIF